MYVDASPSCNNLNFQLGNTGVGTTIPTRTWSIKVIQFPTVFLNNCLNCSSLFLFRRPSTLAATPTWPQTAARSTSSGQQRATSRLKKTNSAKKSHFCTKHTFQSYNYNGGGGRQLANQRQSVCVRRENNNCRICYYAVINTDFNVSGKAGATATTGMNSGPVCCGYGTTAATKVNDSFIPFFFQTFCS